ncbi:hypothetical protein [Salsuginibacillus kocurii]|uniref:hypothetical protein n=1 Tax=Salsuginibacillus kocurii TaxID=427078 RepID=UPI00036163E3|nr:hypothetical protein [Salsuginibacillus kocurii]
MQLLKNKQARKEAGFLLLFILAIVWMMIMVNIFSPEHVYEEEPVEKDYILEEDKGSLVHIDG